MPARHTDRSYGRNLRANKTSRMQKNFRTTDISTLRISEATSQDEKLQATRLAHGVDESMGFARYDSGRKRVGWLYNMHSVTIEDERIPAGRAGVDFYFIQDDGGTFKATVEHDPYFLIAVRKGKEADVEEWCRRKFEGLIKRIRRIEKEDLQMPNHLLGYRRPFLELNFQNVSDLLAIRREILPIAEKNRQNVNAMDTYAEVATAETDNFFFDNDDDDDNSKRRAASHLDVRPAGIADSSDYILDIREYDVPYHVRVSIDKDIRIGKWYTVEAKHGSVTLKCIPERIQRADPVVLAYDIETTKLPLKFPDAAFDQIMMISYMIDGQGFLITNREIVSEDIADFEYTPKPEYDGPFLIFNEPDEKAVIERFFLHIKEARPNVIATYNGDFFDWPFVEARASVLGIDMYQEIGFQKNSEDIYQSKYGVHMDCFAWVNRDSYLPQGSRGLKAVTVAKLGYDPDELDPELMTKYANEKPQTLAEYSVSDAVATYYLYMKYVHPFIFSLCTIIPLNPDDVLRKGTGTLCEMLLMVQAYQKQIVLPNKHKEPREAFWEGHLLESETYVGGHVESIEAGVFRSDIPVAFNLDSTAVDELIKDLDNALTFSITVEEKKSLNDITNYEQVKAEIIAKLNELKANPARNENPSIYHLDVASMYPNIMTTNRLQPDSMIEEGDCAACDFNRPGKTCDRRMPWSWRGEFLPAQKNEYNMVRHGLEMERFPGKFPNSPLLTFQDLSSEQQAALVKKRLTDYSKKIYHKIHDAKTLEREAIICQRENPFYVDTVKDFRDRRYEFKGQQKVWKNKTEALRATGAAASEVEEAKKLIVLYDSLQLAHKVILNSFYGYVMRKGSRWYSMEMAGVTCLTGARIIQMARELVERIGRPLELDTDGIWCMLPATFPENVSFEMVNGKQLTISYPCVMLNHLVHGRFTNHQYQTLVDPKTFQYKTHSDNTIFFEVDGPYRAMILPTSKEEDKNLKKRYAVFNHDGSLAELKGFEVKRRGELKLIKIFQTQIFKFFLEGASLVDTYASVAKVANRWLDVLYQQGSTLADEELIDLICENRSMSKTLEEYGAQKSTSITTARRLAEFLGQQMVKDKGLNCKYIIAAKPKNAPVTDRAIPTTIFSADDQIKRFFLRKWLKEDPIEMNPRALIDWDYYLERLGSVIQKLITIPAALQKIRNPVPRIAHPDWLQRRINVKDDRFKQKKATDFFEKAPLSEISANLMDHRLTHDVEDFGTQITKAKMSQTTSRPIQKRKEPDIPTNPDPYAVLPSKMPSPTEDYEGFLAYQKKKWRIQRQAQIRRRKLFGERNHVANDTLGGYFRSQAETLFSNTWQILQIRESDSPGLLCAFVLINNKIHSLKIKVSRQLFLNIKKAELPDVDIEGCHVEKVHHTLPNGHPSVHLFRITLDEEVYIREAEPLQALFNHPSVEGVYEKQLPLSIRAILHIGGLCTFDENQHGVLGKGLESGFDLSTLRRTQGQQSYLQDTEFGVIYLYHVKVGPMDIIALVSNTKREGKVLICDPRKEVQELPNLARLYGNRFAELFREHDDSPWQSVIEYTAELSFQTRQLRNRRKFNVEVSDTLKRLRAEESKPTILIIESPERQRLLEDIPSLLDLPEVPAPRDSTDGRPPILGWQNFVANRLVSNYLSIGSWLGNLIALARYGDLPLGNLEGQDPLFLIDVAYARRLEKNNVVLWWSASALPDHAGYEKDQIRSLTEVVEAPHINNPGTYSSVCIELDVRNLAINTLLTSSLINELEGVDSITFNNAPSQDDDNGGAAILHSDNAFANAGIAVLKEMIKAWWAEACKGSGMADIMVQHLIRWVESTRSCLYDRSLQYYIRTMSKKAFQQLMNDFKRVGSHVVYASSSRLLLQTTKAEVGTAFAYSQYILKSIKAKPMFHFLDLEIKEYWDYLIWYDEYNYGGKACAEVVASNEQQLETIMHWQMSTFMPRAYQPIFSDWVVEFIELMHTGKANRGVLPGADNAPRPTQLQFQSLTQDPSSTTPTDVLSKQISRPLKKEIPRLITRHRQELAHPTLVDDHAYPILPGSHLNLTNVNPVLFLVKNLMQVFSLDRGISLEVRVLRSELLRNFEIREFSAQARWENPSASLKIENIICDVCTMNRDIDLCRDEDILPDAALPNSQQGFTNGEAEGHSRNQRRAWLCLHCHHPYNRLAIEEYLIGRVQGMLIEWEFQDIRCVKCGAFQQNELMDNCACGARWAPTLDRDHCIRRLKVMHGVATGHGLQMLEEVLNDVLKTV